MTGEKVKSDATASARAKADTGAPRTNERSEISFPYMDLDDAIDVAKHLYNRTAINGCPLDELAAEMRQTTSSGNFRLKTATARIFGLVEKDGQSSLKLTDLGCRMVSPDGEIGARADAFIAVPLYNQIYEKYLGKLLPPTKALEREMQNLGVSSKQTMKARHAFQRSAKQAGYFNAGEDRLVRPRVAAGANANVETIDQKTADERPLDRTSTQTRRNGSSSAGGSNYHPFIIGLLDTLPEPGTLWTVDGRAAWLQAAAQNFTLIYKGEGKIDVHVSAANTDKAVQK
jgi:hypothetical protein